MRNNPLVCHAHTTTQLGALLGILRATTFLDFCSLCGFFKAVSQSRPFNAIPACISLGSLVQKLPALCRVLLCITIIVPQRGCRLLSWQALCVMCCCSCSWSGVGHSPSLTLVCFRWCAREGEQHGLRRSSSCHIKQGAQRQSYTWALAYDAMTRLCGGGVRGSRRQLKRSVHETESTECSSCFSFWPLQQS